MEIFRFGYIRSRDFILQKSVKMDDLALKSSIGPTIPPIVDANVSSQTGATYKMEKLAFLVTSSHHLCLKLLFSVSSIFLIPAFSNGL